MNPLQEIEGLLKQGIGLDPTALGRVIIERSVNDRAGATAMQGWSAYLEHLLTAEDELQCLADLLVAPESCFFRDRPAFDALGRLAVQCWLTAAHGEHLRLLSVGCGSGEEPYSMAMELLESGFPAERIRIDAVDASGAAISRARCGVYPRTAFRGSDLCYAERYFKPVPEGLKLDAQVRQTVTYFRGNVLSDSFLSGRGEYDFIVCRDLLCYFDGPSQTRVIQVLHQALNRNGVFFVGPTEAGLLNKPDFVSVDIPNANAFLKAGKRRVKVAAQTARHLRTKVLTPVPASQSAGANREIRSALDLAARLAERSQWADVLRLCEAHIREHGESAQALYLLGRVRDAKGELEPARELYRRALSLNSEHTFASLRLAQLPDASTAPTPASAPTPATGAPPATEKGKRQP